MKKSTIFWIALLVGVLLGIIIFRLVEIYDENKNMNKLENYIAITNNTLVNVSSNITEPEDNIPNNDIDNYLEKYFSPNIVRSVDKVSAVIKEGTLTRKGVTLIITDDNNPPYIDYADYFYLYIKEKNEWKPYRIVNYFYSPSEIATIPTFERIKEQKINWTGLYGELDNGEYLLLMSVPTEHDYEKNLFGVEFTIE